MPGAPQACASSLLSQAVLEPCSELEQIKLRAHLDSCTKMIQNSCGKPRQTLAALNYAEPSLLLGIKVPKVS